MRLFPQVASPHVGSKARRLQPTLPSAFLDHHHVCILVFKLAHNLFIYRAAARIILLLIAEIIDDRILPHVGIHIFCLMSAYTSSVSNTISRLTVSVYRSCAIEPYWDFIWLYQKSDIRCLLRSRMACPTYHGLFSFNLLLALCIATWSPSKILCER